MIEIFFCICIWNGGEPRIQILTWLLRHIFGYFYGNIQSFRYKEKKWQISKNLSKAHIYFFSRFFVTTHFDNFFFFSSQNRKWLPNIRKLSQGRTSEKSSDATAKNLPVNRESSKPNFKVGNFYQIHVV